MLAIVLLATNSRSGRMGDASRALATSTAPECAQTFGSVRDAVRHGCGDVVLVRPDTLAMAGWAQRLTCAAGVDDRVATVSALSLPGGADEFAANAAVVGASALCLRPSLPAPSGPCVLLRRSGLELVGWPRAEDEAAALAEFAGGCTATGLLHVLADDLLVFDDQPAAAPGSERAQTDPDRPDAPVARARSIARRAVAGMSVTVDARLLDGAHGGSQVHTLALLSALAAGGGAHVRVLLGPEPRADARALIAELELDTLSYEDAIAGATRSAVVHRPMQVFTPADMALLRLVGERLVVTQHDSILFHNPTYFRSVALWRSYRRSTSQALAEADRVVFSTVHARDEALRDELVTLERSAVVALGTDHAVTATEIAPPALRSGDDRPFLLCLGSDLRHKNRPFALLLAGALRDLGWDGRLVLAGAHAEHGSSAENEQRIVATWPHAADTVITLDHVRESEREWLMSHCAAVVFASVSEGFGLPPFEAARRGVPCLFAWHSAMAELLPEVAATIVPWNPQASARLALAVLTDPAQRARHIELLRAAAQPLTWQRFAGDLIDVYEAAAGAPRRAVSALVTQADERELDMRALDALLRTHLDAIGPDALGLVGPGGILPADVQRALLAAAGRRPARAALFALLRAGYRIGHRDV